MKWREKKMNIGIEHEYASWYNAKKIECTIKIKMKCNKNYEKEKKSN